MDIKAKALELVDKIKSNPKLLAQFREDPVGVVESLIGIDLPNDQIEKVVDLIKAKIDLDKIGGMLGGLFGK